MTPVQKLVVLAVLILLAMAASFAGAWQIQEWRYGDQLSKQANLYQDDLALISGAASAQAKADQAKRLALEQQLATSDQQRTRELSDAQRNQARLRDRLATSDLRLSVLIDTTDSASGCNVSTDPGSAGVVHGAQRARLDPAHAQRILAISGAGDEGLIALRACQAYVKTVSGQGAGK
ncbi:lysis protein [Pseudomonas sp. ADAK18]|uniref:lysis system i-spanin subunit Rz n=1 Tax=Pseudomonas sp. ADAK18 TaxID=2730848 RepID=UPI0014631601|nr:lysis system i-spanin subunit Rz [Pseudomonas sp. ADAK18]QJI29892.1 lysis protein [Pseudomonas sp. ADAK18]